MSEPLATPSAKKRPRRWPWILLGVWLLFSVVLGVFWSSLRSAPSYWNPPNGADPAVALIAEELESFMVTQTTTIRPEEERWKLELTAEQINAWLASRLPQWLANQGVDRKIVQAVPRAMVHMGEGEIEWAAEVHWDGWSQVVRGVYRPTQQAEGKPSRLQLQGMYLGRVPVTTGIFAGQVASRTGARGEEIRRAMESVELRLPLMDKRVVEVVGVEFAEGKAVLTCVTRRKK